MLGCACTFTLEWPYANFELTYSPVQVFTVSDSEFTKLQKQVKLIQCNDYFHNWGLHLLKLFLDFLTTNSEFWLGCWTINTVLHSHNHSTKAKPARAVVSLLSFRSFRPSTSNVIFFFFFFFFRLDKSSSSKQNLCITTSCREV